MDMTKQLALFDNPDGFHTGDLVRHRLNNALVGVIVRLDTDRAKIELKTWPDQFYRDWFQDKPMPVLICNLVLAE